ncbi:MAG: hypothetical protein WCA84_18795 [Ignavibacteriaceae bacterium]
MLNFFVTTLPRVDTQGYKYYVPDGTLHKPGLTPGATNIPFHMAATAFCGAGRPSKFLLAQIVNLCYELGYLIYEPIV